ncbi:Clp protease N-terminal domain-containing protein [Sphaerisporangium sp. TRM90804]|uniref:Clp protease N-terminal domain-containing protein n=1 Tax=Sphaerisporangium sp. TRM90804 TaxID=3031113 RepID=UPI002447AC9F|nr:Clp protease N-terminal domain-containing protein [Sphaerisporangium sp. TRM90804]MDH2424239.1 Clp protease N-terminal domain-containing protein [Sphaerisporangium sp. TRM90804]
MSMFTRFTPPARRAVVRAGLLAMDAGHTALDDRAILLALAELRPFQEPLDAFGVTAAAVRAALAGEAGRPRDADLLAGLGIDLAEVRRRMSGLVSVDDPARWRLTRARLRPLRVVLSGPAADLPLTPKARKVVEVALHRSGSTGRVTGEDLLRGLLADGSNPSVRIMRRDGADLGRLAAALGFARRAA